MSKAAAAPREPAAEPGPLARFNALPAQAARQELLTCCTAAAWADSLAAGRPYASPDAAARQSDAAVAAMSTADLAAALAGHPRIGQRAGGPGSPARPGSGARSAAWSRQEQSGMRDADQQTSRSLAELNLAYEERFGHIYLVCATGRSAPELLALLRGRLGNDPEAEWHIVRSELQKINQLRLRRLLADAP